MLQNVRFKAHVVIEPLVNSWYAWPMLLYPVSLGLTTKNVHLRLLESFLRSPADHVAMAKNPRFRGGPFVQHEGPLRQVEALIESSRRELAELIALAEAIESVSTVLEGMKDGRSVEPLYATLPPPLRGITELRYDLRNNASLRLFESLVYAKFSLRALQSVVLSQQPVDARPFALSTPRFGGAPAIHARLPFASEELGSVLRARSEGVPFGVLAEILSAHAIEPFQESVLAALVEEDIGPRPSPYPTRTRGIRVRYFGHAALLFEIGSTTVMVDPVISYPDHGALPRFSYDDLPDRIDLVLLTHNHQDHVLLETLLQIKHRIGLIVVPRVSGDGLVDISLRQLLKSCGFSQVIDLGEMEALAAGAAQVIGLPFLGEHGDLSIVGKLGYAIIGGGATAVVLADSNNLDSAVYSEIAKGLGPVDAVFIGMECAGAPVSWLYGAFLGKPLARPADQSRRLNGSNCARAHGVIEALAPRAVFVYAMGSEPWVTHVSSVAYDRSSPPIVESTALVSRLRDEGITAERLYGRRELIIAEGSCTPIGEPIPEPF